MIEKKKTYLIGFIVSIVVVCTILFLYNKFMKDTSPEMSISAITDIQENNDVILECTVTNHSGRAVTFEEGNFVRVMLDNNEIPFACKIVRLESGEEKTVRIKLPKLDPDVSHNLTLTTSCKEGTTATYKTTIQAE